MHLGVREHAPTLAGTPMMCSHRPAGPRDIRGTGGDLVCGKEWASFAITDLHPTGRNKGPIVGLHYEREP